MEIWVSFSDVKIYTEAYTTRSHGTSKFQGRGLRKLKKASSQGDGHLQVPQVPSLL